MTDGKRRHRPGARPVRVRTTGRRGAVALEYILISALVAIALIGAFRAWGHMLYSNLAYIAWDSSAALVEIIPAR